MTAVHGVAMTLSKKLGFGTLLVRSAPDENSAGF